MLLCVHIIYSTFFQENFILLCKSILRHWVLFVTNICCQERHPSTREQEQLCWIFCGTCTSCHFLWKNDKGTKVEVWETAMNCQGWRLREWMKELLVFWSYFCVCCCSSSAEQAWHEDWYNFLAVELHWELFSVSFRRKVAVNCPVYLVRCDLCFNGVWCASACFSRFILSMPHFKMPSFYLLFKVLERIKAV